MILSFVVGITISVGIVLTRELLSNRFRSKDDVEAALKVPVLTVIPLMKKRKNNMKKKTLIKEIITSLQLYMVY